MIALFVNNSPRSNDVEAAQVVNVAGIVTVNPQVFILTNTSNSHALPARIINC